LLRLTTFYDLSSHNIRSATQKTPMDMSAFFIWEKIEDKKLINILKTEKDLENNPALY